MCHIPPQISGIRKDTKKSAVERTRRASTKRPVRPFAVVVAVGAPTSAGEHQNLLTKIARIPLSNARSMQAKKNNSRFIHNKDQG